MAILIKKNNALTPVGISNIVSKDEQTKTVALNMASGDQEITPDANKTLSKVTVTKPDTLVSENIKKDVVIGGVTGSLEAGITPTGNINLTNTTQTDVTNYATAQVVDANLVAGNIKNGVSILGVTGNYSGGGGSVGFAFTFSLVDRNYSPDLTATTYYYEDGTIKTETINLSGDASKSYTNLIAFKITYQSYGGMGAAESLFNSESGKTVYAYNLNTGATYSNYTFDEFPEVPILLNGSGGYYLYGDD